MNQRSWVAGIVLPLLFAVGTSSAQDSPSEKASIVGLESSSESGTTTIRIETTTSSVSYISYSRDDLSFVVDIYGLEMGDIPAFVDVSSPQVRSVSVEQQAEPTDSGRAARFVIQREAPGPTSVRVADTTLVIEAANGRVEKSRSGVAALASGDRVTGRALPTARRIESILTESLGAGELAVTVYGDGKLQYESFMLDSPPRLVIDLPGVDNRVEQRQFEVRQGPVNRIRVAQFQAEPEKVARIVLDLSSVEDYRIRTAGERMEIRFGGDLEALPMNEVALGGIDVRESAQGAPPTAPGAQAAGDYDAEYDVGADEEGTLISLDLKNADVKDVLRYFSEISGLNIILDPGVSGNITVRLIDVPWNKALDIILKAHGYGRSLDGNVLRIAAIQILIDEETAAAEFTRKREEARPFITMTRPISYGSASDIAGIVQQTALSTQGSIIIDQRTNTLVITEVDIEEYRERILNLIRTLDAPTPQVEIEARIVETTKTWSKNFGIQWGFNQAFEASTGSTTDLVFPNSGIINGDLISSGGFSSRLPEGGWAVNLPGAGANVGIGFHLADITDTFQLDVALSALEDEGNGRVLSAPRITTQSNTAASIQSGSSIPVQTIANNTITVQYIAANLNLTVTPQITPDNTIILDVTVTQSTPDFGTQVGLSLLPPITTRQAQTKLMVPDGGTAVIGGVFQVNESDIQNRVPGLNAIPVLGWLFKNKTTRRSNNELLIFITPKIKSLS